MIGRHYSRRWINLLNLGLISCRSRNIIQMIPEGEKIRKLITKSRWPQILKEKLLEARAFQRDRLSLRNLRILIKIQAGIAKFQASKIKAAWRKTTKSRMMVFWKKRNRSHTQKQKIWYLSQIRTRKFLLRLSVLEWWGITRNKTCLSYHLSRSLKETWVSTEASKISPTLKDQGQKPSYNLVSM